MLATLLIASALAGAPAGPVTLDGVGEIRVGLGLAELRRRFAAVPEYEPDPGMDCSYWTSPHYPGLAMMVVGGRVVRIDFDDPRWRTRSGAAVGMTEGEIRAIYGARMRVEPHPYTGPEGHYLVYRARSEPLGMIFETDGERAISWRVGYWENVQWIEGCS